jgi:MFS family permease
LPSLNFSALQQAAILNAFPVAAVVAMFFSNQFADRNFAAEKFLAFSQLVGGLAMTALAFTTDFWTFFALMLVHCLLYVPTLSIVNSIAFAHLKEPRDFGFIRMGGTIGWVLAAWPFTFILVDWKKVAATPTHGLLDWLQTVLGSGLSGAELQHGIRWTYVVSGVASLLLAAFSLALPHTPPKKAEKVANRLAWLEAMRLLSRPFVLVLWLVAFADTFVLNAYFNWAGSFLGSPQVGIKGNWIMPIMSIGQVAEILTMAVLGVTLKRFGWRLTMIVGILGHLQRFGVFAFFPQATGLIILVFVLHGICYAFFFAAVYIFVDEYFPKDARSSAQGLFNVMILGVGVVVANTWCPRLMAAYTANGITDFRTLFVFAGGVALAAAVTLALFFHPPPLPAEQST